MVLLKVRRNPYPREKSISPGERKAIGREVEIELGTPYGNTLHHKVPCQQLRKERRQHLLANSDDPTRFQKYEISIL